VSFWRRSLGPAVIMVVQSAASRVLGVLSNGILARLLTPVDWGALQAVVNLSATLVHTFKLSVDAGLQIRLSETQREPGAPSDGELLGAGLGLLAATALATLVVAHGFGDGAARLFGDRSLAPWMGLGGWLAVGQLVGQIGVVLLAYGAFRTFAAVNTWVSVGYVAVLGCGYFAGVRGLGFAAPALVAMQLSTSGLMLWCAARTWRRAGVRVSWRRLGSASRELLALVMPVYLASAVPAIVWLFVTAEVARTTGLEALGSLRIVASLNQIVVFVPGALAQTFVTQFAGVRGAADQVPTQDFVRYLRLIIAGSTWSALGTAALSPWLVPLIFGGQHAAASRLVSLGVMTATVQAIKQAVLVGLLSERRTSYALLDSFIASATCAGLAALWTPTFGVTGLVVAEFSGHLLALVVLCGRLAPRVVGSALGRQAAGAAVGLACGLLGLVFAYRAFDLPWRGAWLATLCAGALPGLAFLLFTPSERAFVLDAVRRGVSRGLSSDV